MTSTVYAWRWFLLGVLCCNEALAEPPRVFRTGYVFPGFAVADSKGQVQIAAADVRVEGELAAGASATVVFQDCRLSCNAFGDLMPEGEVLEARQAATLEPIEVFDREGWGRMLFSIRFADSRFANRFYLAASGHPALPHKLLVAAEDSAAIAPQGKAGEYDLPLTYAFTRVLPLSLAQPPEEFDAPLPSFLLTSRPYWTDRVPFSPVVRADISGAPGSDGGIVLDGNRFSLEAFGEGGMSTLMGFGARPVHFEEQAIADPLGRKRRLFQLVPRGDPPPTSDGLQFALVVSPTCLGDHRLIIRRDDELLGILPLSDREYVPHLRLLQGLSEKREQAAVKRLYQAFRGSIHLHGDKQHLTRFDLRVRGLTPGDLHPLLDLPHVSGLSLTSEEPMTAERLAVLPRLPRLVDLALRGAAVDPEIFEQLPHLRTLGIQGQDWSPIPPPPVVLSRRALAAIGRMRFLTDLSLTGLELESESLRPLASLRALKSLRIHNTKVGLNSLLELNRALPELEIDTSGGHFSPASQTVRLMGAGITDADVAAVAELPWLEILHLESCENITDAAAAAVPAAKNLVELRLTDAKRITDQGIHGWSRLTKLHRLTLSCPQLSDRTVDELIALGNLEEIELRGEGVTQQGFELLRQELPKCKVAE